MWGHYLLTFYRSLSRNWSYALLNVLGLAVGIAVFLTLWLDVRFETGFERWVPQSGQVYLLREWFQGLGWIDASMGAALEELKGDYPGLVGTRDWGQNATIRQGDRVTGEQFEVVDQDFFRVFDLPMAAGDKATALRTPDNLLLTQSKAQQYFGKADPLGRRLVATFGGAVHTYRVVGVLRDLPRNSDLQFDFVVPFVPGMATGDKAWRRWGDVELTTWLKFETPAQARVLDADLDNFVDRHAAGDVTPPPAHRQLRLKTAPLRSLHLDNPKDAATVAALAAVGLLTLGLAALNYVNLATARAGLRAREVAVRRSLGATGRALMGQFLCEALATSALAALIGLALCELTLPLANAAGGLTLRIDYWGGDSIVPIFLTTTLLVGLAAGLYPAVVLAGFQPAQVLASARTPGGGRSGARLREGLVTLQFAIAIAFTAATAVIIAQTHYVREADLGFRRSGLIVVNSFDNSDLTNAQRASLLAAWRAMPGVAAVTASNVAPGNDDHTETENVKRPGAAGKGPLIHFTSVEPDFFSTYGVRLEAGRLLDPGHGGDAPPEAQAAADNPPGVDAPKVARNVILSARAVTALGFRDAGDAIGKPLAVDANDGPRPLTIVGVIGDVRFRSPHAPTPPMIYLMRPGVSVQDVASLRFAGADPKAVLAGVGAAWRSVAPGLPIDARTVERNLDHYYRADDRNGRLFAIGAGLAVAIGAVGLYGLASFNTTRRVREIGIRKTLGASTVDILRLLVSQFLRPVLLANLLAWPVAWLVMRGWLAGFDQRIGLGPVYFLGATALALAAAFGAVISQALAVAAAEPAKALRYE